MIKVNKSILYFKVLSQSSWTVECEDIGCGHFNFFTNSSVAASQKVNVLPSDENKKCKVKVLFTVDGHIVEFVLEYIPFAVRVKNGGYIECSVVDLNTNTIRVEDVEVKD